MKYGELIKFKKDLYFDGAVQIDWFYDVSKSKKVAENFVFHGKEYFDSESTSVLSRRKIDTITLTKNLIKKMSDKSANPLSLIISDYGTGKSHYAVTLARLLSGNQYMPETYQTIINNIKELDTESADVIDASCQQKNFVIVLNGMRDFNLNSELLKATLKSLKLFGLDTSSVYKINSTIETALIFFDRNKTTFKKRFVEIAREKLWSGKDEDILSAIRDKLSTDEEALEIVNQLYYEINGQFIRWDEAISASSILEMLVNDYCGENGPFGRVVLLFDEFGRYLQYASGVGEAKSGSSALQQIFETSQNAQGIIQVINFIQSDIKAYLQRVDQSMNISRYIGRFDASDKYYISSNLETVFANLIQRKNKKVFEERIISWQRKDEYEWKRIFDKINEWAVARGIWKNYHLFRKVVVEGIYPMHPISTYMLTQLSDYLQNRSSLTLVSSYLNRIKNQEIETPILILPEELLTGDLYVEMLSAEQEGRQLTQYCILYDNLIRKFGDKLSEGALKVLRANLVIRMLRFKTKSHDDVLLALSMCSGLPIKTIKEELEPLENEYGVIGFDDHANCYDFMEESNGAHDYKIVKKRMLAQAKPDLSILNSIDIQEYAKVTTLQNTSFAVNKHITTAEWNFKQELLRIEDVNQEMVDRWIKDWQKAITHSDPKGLLVWFYVHKDTNPIYLNNLIQLSKKTQNMPIVFMVLNDADNKLFDDLKEYNVIRTMPQDIIGKFERHYLSDRQHIENAIVKDFYNLKKERLYATEIGIQKQGEKLNNFLSRIFEVIYPKTIPFHIDAFMTKSNKVRKQANGWYCVILRTLLSQNMTILNSVDPMIRTRFSQLLSTNANTSWKCVDNQLNIIPPEENSVRDIYYEIVNTLDEKREIMLDDVFQKYYLPPYGLNDYEILLLLTVVCCNRQNLRISFKNKVLNPMSWKDIIVPGDAKVDFKNAKASKFISVDNEIISEKFNRLFKEIMGNTNVLQSPKLKEQLDMLLENNDIPENLSAQFTLVNRKLVEGMEVYEKWLDGARNIKRMIEKADLDRDVDSALDAVIAIDNFPVHRIFGSFEVSDNIEVILNNSREKALNIINNYADEWISNLHCEGIPFSEKFIGNCDVLANKFQLVGYNQFALKVLNQKEQELEILERAKRRNDLYNEVAQYISEAGNANVLTYDQSQELIRRGKELHSKVTENENLFDRDSKRLKDSIVKATNVLIQALNQNKKEITDIWDDLDKAENLDDFVELEQRIKTVLKKKIAAVDRKDLKELLYWLTQLSGDLKILPKRVRSRRLLPIKKKELNDKYSESDYDFSAVIANEISNCKTILDAYEKKWIDRHMSWNRNSREAVYKWKETTKNLPSYLSNETLVKVQELDAIADEVLSEGRIEDVVHYFSLLSREERKKCLMILEMMKK